MTTIRSIEERILEKERAHLKNEIWTAKLEFSASLGRARNKHLPGIQNDAGEPVTALAALNMMCDMGVDSQMPHRADAALHKFIAAVEAKGGEQ